MTSWINRAAGVAARNGTASHTITFPAASAGSLLVVAMAGAVTHTMSTSGYTSRLAPVNNTELHVWTKTATAGESSFTVTHNASDYAVAYEVLEFPSGSTWAGGTSSANASTWPALTGLTGSANTVVGGLSEIHLSGDPAYSATWTAPWTEDIDSDTAFATTEGVFFTTGFQDAYASSSATPVTTDTTNRTDERVTWAVVVAAAGAAAVFPPSTRRTRRAIPPRRPRAVPAPVRAQVNPPVPPAPVRAVRRQRGFLVRRPELAQVVPTQQAVAAPSLTQRATRGRLRPLALSLLRPRPRGDVTPPQDQPPPPAPRVAPRRRLLPRREPAATGGAMTPDTMLPAARQPRRRSSPARRPAVTVPVPAQQSPATAPPYPPSIAKVRRWWATPRRAKTATPVPAQVVLTAPAYPPAPPRGRRLGVLAHRARTPAPVPAQIVVQPPGYPPQPVRGRRAGMLRRRPQVATPVPAQTAPQPPLYPPLPTRARRQVPQARRRHLAPVPAAQALPFPAPVLRRRALVRKRVRVTAPVPVQILPPPWAPVVVRGLRRVVATVCRTRPGMWLFGGTGITASRGKAAVTARTATTARPGGRVGPAARVADRDTATAHIEEA